MAAALQPSPAGPMQQLCQLKHSPHTVSDSSASPDGGPKLPNPPQQSTPPHTARAGPSHHSVLVAFPALPALQRPHPPRHRAHSAHQHEQEPPPGLCSQHEGRPQHSSRVLGYWTCSVTYPTCPRCEHQWLRSTSSSSSTTMQEQRRRDK